MSKNIIGYIYKIIYPNGKIYVGSDHCRSLDGKNKAHIDLLNRYRYPIYFGSSTNEVLKEDSKTWDVSQIQREILVPLRAWSTVSLLLSEEKKFISELKSNSPEVGYNLPIRKCCSVENCGADTGKFYKNEYGWLCVKHYLKQYHLTKGKSKVKNRYKNDPEYRENVLKRNKTYRESLSKDVKSEKRRQIYLQQKNSGSLKKYREKNKEKISETKRKFRKENAGKIAIAKAMHYMKNRDRILKKLREYSASMPGRFAALKSRAKKGGIFVGVSYNEWRAIVADDTCHYCKKSPILVDHGYRTDRKDNAVDYFGYNMVPCCPECNKEKGAFMSYETACIVLGKRRMPDKNIDPRPFKIERSLEIVKDAVDKLMQIPKMSIVNKDDFEFIFEGKIQVCIQPLFMKYPKAEWLENNAIIFRPDEILNKFSHVKNIIMYRAHPPQNKIGARKCEIRNVDATTASVFFSNNHFMTHRPAPTIGLFYNETLVAALSYKQRYRGSFIEIFRFAIKQGCLVPGAVSRLVNHVSKTHPHLPTILSYVDNRYHTGISLEASGFLKIDIPHGWMWTDGEMTWNRLKCRANMDERNLSEKEYAAEKGWIKIYDAGQIKYIKENSYYTPRFDDDNNRTEIENSEPSQKFSAYHSNLRFIKYEELKEMAICEDCTLLSTLDEYTQGNYKTRQISWKCQRGHVSSKLVKRFTGFTCDHCETETEAKKQKEKNEKEINPALGGNPLERKKEIYSRIERHCQNTNQALLTTWTEFSLGHFSRSTKINIKCQNNEIRSTTWAVLEKCGCSCAKCRSGTRLNVFKNVAKSEKSHADIKFKYISEVKVGDAFGNLIIEHIINSKKIICKCKCGSGVDVIAAKDKLLKGLCKSCGCLKGYRDNEITQGVDAIDSSIINNKLNDLGYERLEGAVVNEASRIKVKCLNCDEIKIMAWRSVANNCINCVRKQATREAYDKFVLIAEKNGYEMVDTFDDYFDKCNAKTTTRNGLVPLQTKCPKGHTYILTLSAAKIRKWKCKECLLQKN